MKKKEEDREKEKCTKIGKEKMEKEREEREKDEKRKAWKTMIGNGK